MKTYLKNILEGLPWAILSCIFFSIFQFRTNNLIFSLFDFFLLLSLFIFLGAPFFSYLTKKIKEDSKYNKIDKKNVISKFIVRAREGFLYGLAVFFIFILLLIIDETNYQVNWTLIVPLFFIFLGVGGGFVTLIKIFIDKDN